jgi:hypothetical protein
MPLIFPSNTLSDAGYDVENSVRLDDDAYMHKTQSGGNRQIFTMSCWTKLTGEYGGTGGSLLSTDGTDDDSNFHFGIDDGGASGGATDSLFLHIYGADGFTTTPLLRDYFAWYHIVLAVDTTQTISANRMKLYVNNVQQTLAEGGDYPAQNDDFGVNESGTVLGVGTHPGSVAPYALNSYLAEYCLIDGLQLTPSSFGEADSESPTIWKPIDVSGLTFGTNGFYLDFKDSANLGNDANGGTDLTEVNLDATDQATDTPTNNFCTMNPLENYWAASVFTEGMTKILTISGNAAYNSSTIAVKNGKWYFEVELVADSVGNAQEDVIIGISTVAPTTAAINGGALVWGISPYGGLGIRGNGKMWAGTTETTGWPNIDVGDVVTIAVDFDNGYFYMGIDGVWGNSGDPTSGATGTGGYSFTVGTDDWFMGVNRRTTSATSTFGVNFGGSSGFTVSSANQDADGYGNFEYAVPSGYYALCTKNLGAYGG